MSSEDVKNYHPHSGFLGNLNASQEYKLKEAYLTLFQAAGIAPADAKVGIAAPPEEPAQSKSLFSFRGDEPEGNILADFVEACGDVKKEHMLSAFRSTVRFDHPDGLVLRFLRARKWNTGKGLVQLGHTLHWRTCERNVNEVVERGEEFYTLKEPDPGFVEQLKHGKVILHGHDKLQRPIVFVTVAKHDPKAQSTESMELFTIYLIETIRLALSNEVSTASVVFNMDGFGLGNMDYHMVKFLLGCFEQYYPECLGFLFIHKAPWVFSGIWSMIKGWIDPVVASKISFTKKSSDLLKSIDADQLPKFLGGSSPFEYKYIPPKEGENAFETNDEEREVLLKQRAELFDKFDKATIAWATSTTPEDSTRFNKERNAVAEELCALYWKLDPYVRARTLSDRDGSLGQFRTELQSGNVAQPTL